MDTQNATQWFIQLAGERRGPFPAWQISRYLMLKRLHPNSLVSRDGEQWNEVANLPELQPERRLGIAELPETERLCLEMTKEWVQGHADLFPEHTPMDDERDGGSHLKPVARKTTNKFVAYSVVILILLVIVAIPSLIPSPPPVAEPQCDAAAAPGVNWSNCLLSGSQISGSDLSGAYLRNVSLHSSDLSHVIFTGSDLSYGNFALSNLSNTQMDGVSLKGANLRNADLSYANLAGADLSYADLSGTILKGTDFSGARLGYAIWEENIHCMPESVGRCIPAKTKQ